MVNHIVRNVDVLQITNILVTPTQLEREPLALTCLRVRRRSDFERLTEQWEHFARELNLRDDDILTWRNQYGVRIQITRYSDLFNAILQSWRLREGNAATVENLVNIVERLNLHEIADQLKETFEIYEEVKPLEKYVSLPPPEVRSFLTSHRRKVIVIETPHADITIDKIQCYLQRKQLEFVVIPNETDLEEALEQMQNGILICSATDINQILKGLQIGDQTKLFIVTQNQCELVDLEYVKFAEDSVVAWSDLSKSFQETVMARKIQMVDGNRETPIRVKDACRVHGIQSNYLVIKCLLQRTIFPDIIRNCEPLPKVSYWSFWWIRVLELVIKGVLGSIIVGTLGFLLFVGILHFTSKPQSWSNLDQQTRERLLQQPIFIQGWKTNVSAMIELCEADLVNNTGKLITSELIAQLLDNQVLHILQNRYAPKLEFYVPRTLSRREIVSREIFQKRYPDIFAFTGILREELSTYARWRTTIKSSDFIRNKHHGIGYYVLGNRFHVMGYDTQYVLLESKSHYEDILGMNSTQSRLHWLHFQNGSFHWLKSRGNGMASIRDSSTKLFPAEFNEDQFLDRVGGRDLTSEPMCISASPGMGKSVFLTQIGQRLVEKHDKILVYHIPLKDFLPKAKKKYLVGGDKTWDLIVSHVTTKPNEAILLKSIFIHGKIKVDLMFDGFDELQDAEKELSLQLFTTLQQSKSVRLWVSTRPNSQNQLEDNLNTLCYTILPLNNDEQVEYLFSYWKSQFGSNNQINTTMLHDFAEDTSKNLNQEFGDTENFLGVPLHCRLIADIHQVDALIYALEGNHVVPSPLVRRNSKSVPDLIRTFTERKFQHFLNSSASSKYDIQKLTEAHIFEAVRLSFPNWIPKLEHLFPTKYFPELLVQVGLMQVAPGGADTQIQFIHRIFADYFVASFVAQAFSGTRTIQDKKFRKFFRFIVSTKPTSLESYKIRITAADFTFSTISQFIDATLAFSPLTSAFTPVIKMNDTETEALSLACVNNDYFHLFRKLVPPTFRPQDRNALTQLAFAKAQVPLIRFIVESYWESQLRRRTRCVNCRQQVYVSSAHFQTLDTTTFEWFYESPDQCPLYFDYRFDTGIWALKPPTFCPPQYMCPAEFGCPGDNPNRTPPLTLIHVAVSRGDFSVVEYLLNELRHRESLEEKPSDYPELLFACLHNSFLQPEKVIHEKQQILKTLVKISDYFLKERDVAGRTPFLYHNVHFKLLETLVKLNATVDAVDAKGDTILHNAARYLPPEDYERLLQLIPKKVVRHLVNHRGERGYTPLMRIVATFNPLNTTLDILASRGALFTIKDKDNNSLLSVAKMHGRSPECLSRLIKYGAEPGLQVFTTVSKDSDAADKCDSKTVHTLLKEGTEVGIHGSHLKPFVDTGVKASQRHCCDILRAIFSINMEESDRGTSPLLVALSQRPYNFPERLLLLAGKCGMIKSNPEATESLLHILKYPVNLLDDNEYDELVQICLAGGASLEYRDGQNDTLLHLASKGLLVRSIKALLKFGVDADAINGEGKTALEAVASTCRPRKLVVSDDFRCTVNCKCWSGLRENCEEIVGLLISKSSACNKFVS